MCYKKTASKIGNIMIETTEDGVLTYSGIREFISDKPISVSTVCDGPTTYRATVSTPLLSGYPVEEIGTGDTAKEAYENAIIKAVKLAFGLEFPVEGLEKTAKEELKEQAKESIAESANKTEKIAPDITLPVTEPEDTKTENTVLNDYGKVEINCAGATKSKPQSVEVLVRDNFGLARWIVNTYLNSSDKNKSAQATAINEYCKANNISLEQ